MSIFRRIWFITAVTMFSFAGSSFATQMDPVLEITPLQSQSYQIAKAYFLPDYQEDMGGIEADPVDQCASLCSGYLKTNKLCRVGETRETCPHSGCGNYTRCVKNTSCSTLCAGYSKGLTFCAEGEKLETCPQTGCGTYARCVEDCGATVTLGSSDICTETCGGNCVKKQTCASRTVPNDDKTACICDPSKYIAACPTNAKQLTGCSTGTESTYTCFCKAGYKCTQYANTGSNLSCIGTCEATSVCGSGETYFETSSEESALKTACTNDNGVWSKRTYPVNNGHRYTINAYCGKCSPKTCAEINSNYQESSTSTDGKTCKKVMNIPATAGRFITCYNCTCPETVEVPTNGYCAKTCDGNCVKAITCANGEEVSGNSCVCKPTVTIYSALGQYCKLRCNGNCVERGFCLIDFGDGYTTSSNQNTCECKNITLDSNSICANKNSCGGCTRAQTCTGGKIPNSSKTKCVDTTDTTCPFGYYAQCSGNTTASGSIIIDNGSTCYKCTTSVDRIECADGYTYNPQLARCIKDVVTLPDVGVDNDKDGPIRFY